MKQVQDQPVKTVNEAEQGTTTITIDKESLAKTSKKGGNKKKKSGIATDKQKKADEFENLDNFLLPPAAINSSSIEMKIFEKKTAEQDTTNPLMTQKVPLWFLNRNRRWYPENSSIKGRLKSRIALPDVMAFSFTLQK